MEKELCCVNCPHCQVAKDFERLFCGIVNTKIPLERGPEYIEKQFCCIRCIANKNLESPHYQQDDYVELNDGRKFKIDLVYGYRQELKEYEYSGTLYAGNHTFQGGWVKFRQSEIKRQLTREELFKDGK